MKVEVDVEIVLWLEIGGGRLTKFRTKKWEKIRSKVIGVQGFWLDTRIRLEFQNNLTSVEWRIDEGFDQNMLA